MKNSTSTPAEIYAAPAKINLYLRVVARRPDGFHELETVMAGLREVADTLRFEPTDDPGVTLGIHSAFQGRLADQQLPVSDDNLVLRAARRLEQELESRGCSPAVGVHISLVKRIPAAAGLGGGSSDAATTLVALNALWRGGLTPEELRTIAADLGSDVPFFLAETPWVVCTGRGEILQSAGRSRHVWLVLARPAAGLSTPAVFKRCLPDPDSTPVAEFLTTVKSPSKALMAQALLNSLQGPAIELNAEIEQICQQFSREHVAGYGMTGSGSTCFALCSTRRQACCLAARLRARGIPWVQVASTRV